MTDHPERIYHWLDSQLSIARFAGSITINGAPCCSDCNYAKREMSKESFLNQVARIYAHQSR